MRWTDEQWSLFQDVVDELERVEAGGQDGGGETCDNEGDDENNDGDDENNDSDDEAGWTFSPAAMPDGDTLCYKPAYLPGHTFIY